MASPSRQGRLWSKYRCGCLAMTPRMCLCASSRREPKRVFFKDLENRNLSGLFSSISDERIMTPFAGVGQFNQMRFQ